MVLGIFYILPNQKGEKEESLKMLMLDYGGGGGGGGVSMMT